jgi:ornithine carbamoyltransferase
MKKDFLSIWDFEPEKIYQLFKLADHLRKLIEEGKNFQPLKGKSLALIFEKPSTRTRVSFEVAAYQLGARPLFLSAGDLHLGKGESLEDTARVLSRYVQGVIIRTYQHERVVRFAAAADIPVINALSDLLHPCQTMADYYTLWRKGRLNNIKLAYVGDGNNVCHSLILGAARLGVEMVVATPEKYFPQAFILEKAKKAGGKISIITKPSEAVKEADVIYTDVWVSMGKEKERKEREKVFQDYQVNTTLLKLAKPDVLIMHCLPAHRGQEITDEVIDGKNSIVWEQAENRLHIQRAILIELMG